MNSERGVVDVVAAAVVAVVVVANDTPSRLGSVCSGVLQKLLAPAAVVVAVVADFFAVQTSNKQR